MSEKTDSGAVFDGLQFSLALSEDLAGYRGVTEYIEYFSSYYEGVPIHQVVSLMAVASEPIDCVTGRIDPEAPAASGFLPGGVMGIRAVEIALGTDAVLGMHEGIMVKLPSIRGLPKDERVAALDKFSGSIQAVGDAGLELIPNLSEQVSEWGDLALAGDIRSLGYFRRGLGFVLYAAETWRQSQARQMLALTAMTNANDQAIIDFFETQFRAE